MLGDLNTNATSQESLGMAFWRIVLSAGILAMIMSVINVIAVSRTSGLVSATLIVWNTELYLRRQRSWCQCTTCAGLWSSGAPESDVAQWQPAFIPAKYEEGGNFAYLQSTKLVEKADVYATHAIPFEDIFPSQSYQHKRCGVIEVLERLHRNDYSRSCSSSGNAVIACLRKQSETMCFCDDTTRSSNAGTSFALVLTVWQLASIGNGDVLIFGVCISTCNIDRLIMFHFTTNHLLNSNPSKTESTIFSIRRKTGSEVYCVEQCP